MTNKEKAAARAQKRFAKIVDYKKVFSSEQGKRVLYDLMIEHKVMGPTYIKGDAIEMAFLEGQRNVLLRIFSILKMNPDKLKETIQEADNYASTAR